MTIFAGLGEVDSAAPSFALWELSRLDPTTPAFASGSANLPGAVRQPWPERVGAALADVGDRRVPRRRRHRRHARRRRRRLAPCAPRGARRRRRSVTAEIAALVAGDPDVHGQFLAAVRSGRLHLAGRERTKTTIVLLVHEMRLAARELGRRLVDRGLLETIEQVFMVKADELDELVAYPHAFAALCAEREQEYEQLFALEPPFIVVGEAPPLSTWPERGEGDHPPVEPGEVLAGISGCPGVARGRARIVRHPCRSRPAWNRATSSWRRSPTRRGRRCSSLPPPSSSTSAPRSATP